MLKVTDLEVAYGPISVLKGISFEVPAGSIVTLIGANGAGKTTTLKTISGLKQPLRGQIEFDGQRIDGRAPQEIVALGIAHVPEGRKIFRNLTVRENLLMGGYIRRDKAKVNEAIERVLTIFPILRERYHQLGSTLSGGQQQMLAFARALVSGPRLLLLDEPSMGLAPQIVEDIAEHIVQFRQEGMTILLVEQNANLALAIADYGYVLETGTIVLAGKSHDLRQNDQVQKSYLGM